MKAGTASQGSPLARLMALAIHFDQLMREGQVNDQAEIAALGHFPGADDAEYQPVGSSAKHSRTNTVPITYLGIHLQPSRRQGARP